MEIKNIVIASPMHQEIQDIFEKRRIDKNFRFLSEEEVSQTDLNWADAFVSFNMKGNLDYRHLKWGHSLGAGVDRFLANNQWPKNILLTRTICSFGQRISEYCLSFILKDLQNHDHFQQLKQDKKWNPITPKLLNEQKVMIYGTGEIGQTVAKVLESFGVDVYGVSLSGKQKAHFKQVMTLESHYEILSEMNYLINTLPLTKKTTHLLDEKIFKKLSHAGLINVGRGATLKEDDLLGALESNNLKFAVLDVFAEEPLPANHPFWNHPKLFITPHISAVTTPEEGVDCFIETLHKLETKKPLHNTVDISKGY
ncbi:D-2-hydroxyacid dehydrogenase [Bacillus sp. B15-48]|uniref:D-2-hydroxyacid dehydrogenase n=1 Tax=Bacillus sp. B15-48 TaxID=1548601 RepID=UPI00193EDC20|nr:D-2-hydroxyacid dehydrogenase [Bacillus sp. B15-48]MBM4763463.1 D-2-hydroxyacid dehydrogenase [Bacillus sp. B15-48]